ncbi:MAG: hypothetical protein WC508_05015 [Patescibacteria group bacterium]
MAGLIYLISLIYLAVANTANLNFGQEVSLFLNTALFLNKWLFLIILTITLAVFLVGIIITLLSIIVGNKRYILDKLSFGLSCSACITLPILFLPIAQGLVYWGNYLMANSITDQGIADPFKFWFGLILTILMIWG